jgi:peptide/nickel transport system substrate-binding protein
MPFATFIPKILKHDTSAYMLGWGVSTFDALYTLQSLVRTKTSGADGSFNCGRVSDSKLDATIDAIKITTDLKQRDALLREALVTTRDNAYYVPLHHQLRPWAMKKTVSTVHRADDRPEARFTRVD